MSIGLCFINQENRILLVQQSQDNLLWQMPEFPIEIETDLTVAVNNATRMLFESSPFQIIKTFDTWFSQKIPSYLTKKELLTGEIIEKQKWSILKIDKPLLSHESHDFLYSKTQWVDKDDLIKFIAPHKRLIYGSVLEGLNKNLLPTNSPRLTQDFKEESLSLSKKDKTKTL